MRNSRLGAKAAIISELIAQGISLNICALFFKGKCDRSKVNSTSREKCLVGCGAGPQYTSPYRPFHYFGASKSGDRLIL